MGEAAIVRMVRLGIVGLALIIAMASPAFATTETADPPAYTEQEAEQARQDSAEDLENTVLLIGIPVAVLAVVVVGALVVTGRRSGRAEPS